VTTATQFVAWASGQSPGQILAAAPKLTFGALGPFAADGVNAADAIIASTGPQAQANAASAAATSNNIIAAAAAGMSLVAGPAGAALGLALKLDQLFAQSAAGVRPLVGFWKRFIRCGGARAHGIRSNLLRLFPELPPRK
jgi:hypothetical protein